MPRSCKANQMTTKVQSMHSQHQKRENYQWSPSQALIGQGAANDGFMQALTNKQSIPCITTQAKCKVMTAKCPVKHKPLQKGSFSFHSSQNIYTCHFKTSALLIVSFVDTKLNARIKPKCCFQPTIEPKCKMSPWPNSALKTCVTHWHTQMESAREKSVMCCKLSLGR